MNGRVSVSGGARVLFRIPAEMPGPATQLGGPSKHVVWAPQSRPSIST